MKYNVSFEQIVGRLAEVLNDSALTAEYRAEGETSQMFCGWCGGATMSPISRKAFVSAFGEETVKAAEVAAQNIIDEKAAAYERSQFHAHELEADAHLAAGQTAPTRVGEYVWAVPSCMKGESGFKGELRDLICDEDDEERTDTAPRLCVIEKVIRVDVLPMSADECDRLVADHSLVGGSRSDDVTDDDFAAAGGFWNLTKEQTRTFYTVAAAVVDKAGRWYLADAEGYNYVRYYYSPLAWLQMFAPEVADHRRQMAEEKTAEERRLQQEAADRLEAYRARCQKWAHLMRPIAPFEAIRDSCYSAYRESGFRKNSHEAKALRSAETKLNNARRRNLLAMAQTAFPGVKFSLRKESGWGADWCLTWEDGPTDEEFDQATDFNLFSTYHDAFDGMQDYAYTVDEEHTDFAVKFMGTHSNTVKRERKMSQAKRAELVAIVYAAVPAASEGSETQDNDTPHDYTQDEARALSATFGLPIEKLFPRGFTRAYASEIARRVFLLTSYFVAPSEPEPDPTPTGTRKVRQNEQNEAQGSTSAPAVLSLVELPAGGVAVIGSTWKDTYFHKREIKAHGCTWNKEAKQWQATDPATIAALRAWLGLDAPTEGTPTTEADTLSPALSEDDTPTLSESPAAAVAATDAPCYSEAPKSQIWAEQDEALAARYGYTIKMARHNYHQNYDLFNDLKNRNRDRLLLFRMGDCYELYGCDALVAGRSLTLEPIAPHDLCGPDALDDTRMFYLLPVPAVEVNETLRRLLAAGHHCTIYDPDEAIKTTVYQKAPTL